MPSIAAKMVRAFFVGQTIGIVGGLAMYILATAVNALTGKTVLDPTAMFLVTDGFVTAAAIGVELSKDLGQ